MKIERVSYNKIKVTVTTLDLIKWGVSLDNFVQDTPQARELFRTLIKRAEFETGCSFENSRLVVEAVPNKYDGIIFFVTKMEDDAPDLPLPQQKKARIRAKATRRNTAEIFEFEDLEGLIVCAKQVDIIINTDLYSYLDRYYLVAYEDEDTCTPLSEYGDRLSKEDAYALQHIKEHGTMIAENNALEMLKNIF